MALISHCCRDTAASRSNAEMQWACHIGTRSCWQDNGHAYRATCTSWGAPAGSPGCLRACIASWPLRPATVPSGKHSPLSIKRLVLAKSREIPSLPHSQCARPWRLCRCDVLQVRHRMMSSTERKKGADTCQRLFMFSAVVRSVLVHGHKFAVGTDSATC